MSTSLSTGEQMELARLLGVVAEKDEGFIPDSAYRLVHKLVPWPAVEVLIYDEDGKFILTYRDDEFKGWHIPGGYMKPNESCQEACDRHVRKERIAEAVTDLKLIAIHVWLAGEHPFSYPISLIIACKAVGEIVERDDLKWFRRIPKDTIPENHPSYLAHFLEWREGNQGSAVIL